jgi:hypothetical protein
MLTFLRTKANSFLKPMASVSPPIEAFTGNVRHRYLDGELTTTLQLTPERRAEFDKRFKALQMERESVVAKATDARAAAQQQVARAYTVAVNAAGTNFERGKLDLFLEFRQFQAGVLSNESRPASSESRNSSTSSAPPAPAPTPMPAFSGRRRQPVPAVADTDAIPNKIGEILNDARADRQLAETNS